MFEKYSKNKKNPNQLTTIQSPTMKMGAMWAKRVHYLSISEFSIIDKYGSIAKWQKPLLYVCPNSQPGIHFSSSPYMISLLKHHQ